jgi:O-acetyl-ADP-ribose deacetylase (regulator of RNase III)
VIHTVGPVWRGGTEGEPALLARCYRNCLTLAERHGLRSIAFPAISTGVYGYPVEAAARVAVEAVRAHLAGSSTLKRVVFVCFDARNRAAYEVVLEGEDGVGTANGLEPQMDRA